MRNLAVERLLGERLGGDATLQSQLGGSSSRIWPGRRPQGNKSLPAVTYHFVSAPEDTKYENRISALSQPQYLIQVWYADGDALGAEPILDRIFALLDPQVSGGINSSGIVYFAQKVRDHGPFEPLEEGDEAGQIGAYFRFNVG